MNYLIVSDESQTDLEKKLTIQEGKNHVNGIQAYLEDIIFL